MYPEPTRAQVDQMRGPVVLEFGAEWCGYCQEARPHMAALLRAHPEAQHIKVEDGRGKPLGRSFRVKLWPTFVFMRDGQVVAQMSRPSPDEMDEGFAALFPSAKLP